MYNCLMTHVCTLHVPEEFNNYQIRFKTKSRNCVWLLWHNDFSYCRFMISVKVKVVAHLIVV